MATTRATPCVSVRSTSATVCARICTGEWRSPGAGTPTDCTLASPLALTDLPSTWSNQSLPTTPCTDGGAPESHVACPGPVSVCA